jgi:hypothetical protein
MSQPFIYGGNTGRTYADMTRAREIAKALVQGTEAPKNVGEGLNAIGSALLARAQTKRADKLRDQVASQIPPDHPLFPKLYGLPAYRYGTNYHPGGLAVVGEDGPEVVQLPQGAAVQPNPMTMAANPQVMAAINPQAMGQPSQLMDAQAVQVADASGQPTFAEKAADANLDLNVTQAQRMGQLLRLIQAEATLRELEETQGTRVGQRMLEWLPDAAENMLTDTDYGRFKTARDSFVEAAMRADTGATINESEWPRIMNTLMVKPGDDPARIAERRAMRETIIQGLKAAAGADAAKIMPEVGQRVVQPQDLNPSELSDDELLKMLGGGN